MAGHRLLKRKGGVDDISDDFSDFSLSSPATKIRRLDAELPPIVEEEEPALPVTVPNEERALVLFKPIPHSLSLTLNSDLLSQIKNRLPWSNQRDSDWDRLIGSHEEEEEEEEQDKNNHRLALVPWVPQPSSHCSTSDSNANTQEVMEEADEMGEAEGDASSMMMMDVEEQDTTSTTSTSTVYHPTTPRNNSYGARGIPAPAALSATSVPSKHLNSHHLDPLNIFIIGLCDCASCFSLL